MNWLAQQVSFTLRSMICLVDAHERMLNHWKSNFELQKFLHGQNYIIRLVTHFCSLHAIVRSCGSPNFDSLKRARSIILVYSVAVKTWQHKCTNSAPLNFRQLFVIYFTIGVIPTTVQFFAPFSFLLNCTTFVFRLSVLDEKILFHSKCLAIYLFSTTTTKNHLCNKMRCLKTVITSFTLTVETLDDTFGSKKSSRTTQEYSTASQMHQECPWNHSHVQIKKNHSAVNLRHIIAGFRGPSRLPEDRWYSVLVHIVYRHVMEAQWRWTALQCPHSCVLSAGGRLRNVVASHASLSHIRPTVGAQ